MPNAHFELRDIKRNDLRKTCAAMDQALSRLPATTGTTAPSVALSVAPSVVDELRAQWLQLVALLELEPARVLRECPVCKHVAMFEATRCGHCWTKLPVATADDALTDTPPAEQA